MNCRPPIVLGLLLLAVPSFVRPAPPPANTPSPLVLEIQIVEGDGEVHVAGSRARLPLTVRVIDQLGRPVGGAVVSFLMPRDGPGGVFASGLSTEVLTTGGDGKASVHKILWGNRTGTARIRITAMKGRARAGIISNQHIEAPAEASDAESAAHSYSVSKPKKKWIAIAVIAAGAAVGGIVLGTAGSSGGTPAVIPPAGATEPSGVQVGAPSITIGKP